MDAKTPAAGQVPEALGARLAGAFRHDDARPAPPPVQMVPGGLAAPELCMLPRDLGNRRFVPALVQLKIDGIRALYIDGRVVSREGSPLDCALHCVPGLKRLERAFGVPMFFDGEYVEEDGFDATLSAMRRGEGTGVFWIFDAMPYHEWKTDSCERSTRERLALLESLAEKAESPFVGMLKSFTASSFSEIDEHTKRLWAMGYEGVVIKKPSARYRRESSEDWLRWKETITVDCPVVDAMEKDGVLRSLLVRGPEGADLKVGSGWDARAGKRLLMLFKAGGNPVVEIAYNRKAGSAKARHARFIRIREDKRS